MWKPDTAVHVGENTVLTRDNAIEVAVIILTSAVQTQTAAIGTLIGDISFSD